LTYIDTVLTLGTVLLVLPVIVVLLTYTVRGTPKNRLGQNIDQADDPAPVLNDLDCFDEDFAEEDCHACR